MDFEHRFCPALGGFLVLLASALVSHPTSAQTAPPPASAQQYSSAGSLGGVTYTVTRLKRNKNGSLTLSIRLQGTPGKLVDTQAVGFTQMYSPSGDRPAGAYKIIDFGNKKRYEMLVDESGNCLCTLLTAQEFTELNSGKSKDINIKFPAPPADVTSVTVEVPHAEPIDDVPITD